MRLVNYKAHDEVQARKDCPDGKIPVLAYSDGARHALLATGQRLRVKPKNRDISARQRRREDKEFRRTQRMIDAGAATPAQ